MSTVNSKLGPETKSAKGPAIDKFVLKQRRPWYYVALGLLLLCIITRQPLVLLASIFTFLIGFVPEIWYRTAMRHLIIRQKLSEQHLFFGETVTLNLSVENRKALPLPWLQVENNINPPLTMVNARDSRQQALQRDTLISTWLLWSYQRVTRRYRMTCTARGFHIFGPVRLTCSDPFGWLEREIYVGCNETLLVYPLIAPIEAFGLPAVQPVGEHLRPRHLLEDPLWFAGNRQYELGDDPRRIDWKATARVGELRSKIYESTTERRLLILLDTWTYSADVRGVDFEIQELCIAAAASLAMWGLDESYMVGLLTNSSIATAANHLIKEADTDTQGQNLEEQQAKKLNTTTISTPRVSVPFDLDPEQYERILTILARLVPNYNTPIEHILDVEEEMLQPGITILVISSINTLSERTIERLQDLRARNYGVTLVLAGSMEEGKQPVDTLNLPTYHIGGKEKWHELVRTVGEGSSIGRSNASLTLD